MIKKLRNQPYAPKWEQAQKVEQREENKLHLFLPRGIYVFFN
jgi:hypothetical protein